MKRSMLVLVLALFISAIAIGTPDGILVVPKKTERAWHKADSYAYAQQGIQDFADKEYSCLKKLWGKESAWNPRAQNDVKVGGLKAGGIPQILGMSPKLTPAKQIERGLKYIYHRYDTPCNGWNHWKKFGWY